MSDDMIVLDTKGDPGKFNLIGSIMSYNHSRDVIVEASLMTNTINLYSLFSDFALSICIGDKPDDIHRLERAVYGTTRDTFIDLKPYNVLFPCFVQKGDWTQPCDGVQLGRHSFKPD